MSMIIKDKIQQFMIGYPTMSDKYNVAGGILTGSANVHFGDLVKLSGTAGYFEAATNMSSVDEIGGFVVATNVKLAEGFPGTTPATKPGEAFNLLVSGFIAVELDAGADLSNVTTNGQVYVNLTTGKVTTDSSATALPNTFFTGLSEMQGSKKVAEIYVK